MSFLGDWLHSRRARYQADALKATAEARLHERRALLAAKPHKSASEVMEQGVLESTSAGLLAGWGDAMGVWKDYLQQATDFSRGGLGAGAGLTNKRGRRGGDFPFINSESHFLAHLDLSRLLWPNPNIQGLVGGRRRYTLGSGVTVRAVPRGDSSAAKDAARQSQAVIDEFGRLNRFAHRQRTFFDRSSRDGEGIWRLFPQRDGTTTIRTVYGEQLRCPPGESMHEYEYGIKTPPDDTETVEEYAVWSMSQYDQEPDRVPPEEVIYYGPNRDDGVKRSIPDWTLTTGETAELADELAANMGEGSKLQAAIAYIMQHENAPRETIQARGFADASYTKTDPWTGKDVPVKKLPSGTVVETNQNTKFLGSPYNAGIDSHANVFQLLMNRVSARWNAPRWLATSNDDESSFASALQTGAPFVLSTLETQDAISEPFRVLHERVLAVKAAVGVLPANVLDLVEVKVTCPSPVVLNKLQEAQRAEIELRAGTTSPQHEAEMQGREWDKVIADRKRAVAQGWTPEGDGSGGGGDKLNPSPRVPGSSLPTGGGLAEQLESLADQTAAILELANRPAPVVNVPAPVPDPAVRELAESVAQQVAALRELVARPAPVPVPAPAPVVQIVRNGDTTVKESEIVRDADGNVVKTITRERQE